jgi:gliding motility-associated-like protein
MNFKFFKYLTLSILTLISTSLISQNNFKPILKCFVNDNIENKFSGQNQESLRLDACFFTKRNQFYKDSIRIEIDPTSLPNGYTLGDFEIEWKIEGVGFSEEQTLSFKPLESGGYYVNLLLLSKDNTQIGKNNCKLRFSAVPNFKIFEIIPDSLCMDKTVSIPFEIKDGTLETDPIPLKMLSFNMGGLNKVLTDLPDAPSGGNALYESTITVDDYGTNSVIKSSKDINQICITLEHSSLSDLEMTLVCPTGKRIVLFNSYAGKEGKDLVPGGFNGKDVGLGNDLDEPGFHGEPAWQYCFSSNRNNFGTMADEYFLENFKLNIVNNLSMNPKGIYSPEETFDKLIGCPVKGEWKIQVQDNQFLDDGYIFNWGIMFNAESFPVLDTFQNKIKTQYWDNKLAIVQNDSLIKITPKTLGANEYKYTVITDFNCVYDTVIKIGTKLCLTIPNIVSLSSKTGNDKFFVNTGDVKNFDLQIFNRWGNQVFKTNDLNQAWDGKTKSGKVVEEGDYFYIVKLEFNNGDKHTRNGTFLLQH